MRAGSLIVSLFVLALTPSAARAQDLYRPLRDQQSPQGIAYTRYFTKDRFGRKITFYVSGDQSQRLPLVVSVLGSGAYSNFIRRNGQILDAHRIQREVFGTKAHVLIVEKPGVEFLEQHPNQGTAVDGSLEFRREHTLERWSEAISAALRAASNSAPCRPIQEFAYRALRRRHYCCARGCRESACDSRRRARQ